MRNELNTEFMGLTDAQPVLAPGTKEEANNRDRLLGEQAVKAQDDEELSEERFEHRASHSRSEPLGSGLRRHPIRNGASSKEMNKPTPQC